MGPWTQQTSDSYVLNEWTLSASAGASKLTCLKLDSLFHQNLSLLHYFDWWHHPFPVTQTRNLSHLWFLCLPDTFNQLQHLVTSDIFQIFHMLSIPYFRPPLALTCTTTTSSLLLSLLHLQSILQRFWFEFPKATCDHQSRRAWCTQHQRGKNRVCSSAVGAQNTLLK